MRDRLLSAQAGEELCLLGNEAIARGALEAEVRFVSGYPGTPASEIGDTFSRIHRDAGVHFEWSVNEKVALETAFGAAIMGARSLCYMKHLGLAYAGDPLGTIPYVGVLAGLVIVSAGDPGMVVSPNEQDQRHLGRMNMIPVLEPSHAGGGVRDDALRVHPFRRDAAAGDPAHDPAGGPHSGSTRGRGDPRPSRTARVPAQAGGADPDSLERPPHARRSR